MPWLKGGDQPELPFQRRDTSVEAAESMEPNAGTLRALVLDFIRGRLGAGATDDEIEVALGMRHQTASARRRELAIGKWIEDSGERRATRSGRMAIVWKGR
jgi:hypothetical protein